MGSLGLDVLIDERGHTVKSLNGRLEPGVKPARAGALLALGKTLDSASGLEKIKNILIQVGREVEGVEMWLSTILQ